MASFIERRNRLRIRVLDAFGPTVRDRAAALSPSSTISRNLRYVKYSSRTGSVQTDPYWALFLHDGRKGRYRDKPYVWFRERMRDPRLNGGVTPFRFADVRHLSREEYIKYRKRNMLIVSRRLSPMRARPFLSNDVIQPQNMASARSEAKKAMSEFMAESGLLGIRTVKAFIRPL